MQSVSKYSSVHLTNTELLPGGVEWLELHSEALGDCKVLRLRNRGSNPGRGSDFSYCRFRLLCLSSLVAIEHDE